MNKQGRRKFNLISKVEKLSEREWGLNQRILTYDGHALAYYSKAPKDGNYDGIYDRKVNPKQSIAIQNITGVSFMSEQEDKQ